MSKTTTLLASSLLLLLPPSAFAHHGRDFLVVQDYSLPSPLSGNIITNFSWEKSGAEDEFRLEPGFIIGLAPRLGLETTVSFQDDTAGWEYASVDPTLHVQLTGPDSDLPVKVSLSAGYQFGNVGATSEEADGDHHDHADEHHGEDDDHHADGAHSHTHRGIHRHGEDLFHARLVVETDFTASLKGVFNLIAVVPDGGDVAWGYAAGLRYAFSHEVAVGAEAIGDFANHGEHELIAAGYFSPSEHVSLKLGAGFGLTEDSPDFALHAGVIFRW